MSHNYAKPANALRKAQDFVKVGNDMQAMEALHAILPVRRYRTWTDTHEKIMTLFIKLAVKNRENMKDAFIHYRNICQNSNPGSMEKMIKMHIKLAEAKTAEAKQKVEEIGEDVSKLDLADVPPHLVSRALAGHGLKALVERQILLPALQYNCEIYRTIADVIRNNSKLQALYHGTVRAGFKFFAEYNRGQSFRRLCDSVRHHITVIASRQQHEHVVDLNSKDSQKLYLETRFDQLRTAAEMENWQEAYRTIEDIHVSLQTGVQPPPHLLTTFYEKLADIFYASENHLFHAYSLDMHRKFVLEANPDLDIEVAQELATAVLLGALVIPPEATHSAVTFDEGSLHLADLLGFRKEIPSRARLLEELKANGVMDEVMDEALSAYNLLENSFQPLQLRAKLEPVFECFEKHEKMKKYVDSLKRVTVVRLTQQLAKLYSTMKLEKLMRLVPELPPHSVERILANAVHSNQVCATLDHRRGLVRFHGNPLNMGFLRSQLVRLAKQLELLTHRINPPHVEDSAAQRKKVFAAVLAGVEEEHQRVFTRNAHIEQQKQQREENRSKRAEEELRRKHVFEVKRRETEALRLKEEAKRRLKEREDRAKHEDELKEKKLQLEAWAAKDLSAKAARKIEELRSKMTDVDQKAIIMAKHEVEQALLKEKQRKQREKARFLTFFVRQCRVEEAELQRKQFEEHKEAVNLKQEEMWKKVVEEHKQNYDLQVERLRRLDRMIPHKDAFLNEMMNKREAQFEAEKQNIQNLVDTYGLLKRKEQDERQEAEWKRREEERKEQEKEQAKQEAFERMMEEKRMKEEKERVDERQKLEEQHREEQRLIRQKEEMYEQKRRREWEEEQRQRQQQEQQERGFSRDTFGTRAPARRVDERRDERRDEGRRDQWRPQGDARRRDMRPRPAYGDEEEGRGGWRRPDRPQPRPDRPQASDRPREFVRPPLRPRVADPPQQRGPPADEPGWTKVGRSRK